MSYSPKQKATDQAKYLRATTMVTFVLAIVILPLGCQMSPHMPDSAPNYFSTALNGESTAAVPDGWRRTKDGWEHTRNWAIEASGRGDETINELLEIQTQREPQWIRTILQKLRAIPPQWIAMAQVVLIGVICSVSKRLQQKEPS